MHLSTRDRLPRGKRTSRCVLSPRGHHRSCLPFKTWLGPQPRFRVEKKNRGERSRIGGPTAVPHRLSQMPPRLSQMPPRPTQTPPGVGNSRVLLPHLTQLQKKKRKKEPTTSLGMPQRVKPFPCPFPEQWERELALAVQLTMRGPGTPHRWLAAF